MCESRSLAYCGVSDDVAALLVHGEGQSHLQICQLGDFFIGKTQKYTQSATVQNMPMNVAR